MDLYTVIAGCFRGGFKAMGIDVRPRGHEHIPSRGPAILASNHVGYLDFCFVALAPPRPRRQVRFIARHDIFEKRVVGWAMRAMRQIPVDVHGNPSPALALAEERLREGEVVGVHPEGTISPSFVPRAGRTGVVRLAMRTGAPIVPVAVWGSQRLLTKGRDAKLTRGVPVVVRYGEAYVPEEGKPIARTRELMERITELLAVAQAEYPDMPEPNDAWWLPRHLGGTAPTPEEAEERIRRQNEERRRARRRRVEGDTSGQRRPPASDDDQQATG